MLSIYNLLVIVCWVVFLFYWFFTSFNLKQNRKRNYSIYIRLGIAILLILFFWQKILHTILSIKIVYAGFSLTGSIAVILSFAGISLAIWSKKFLGSNWGLPGTKKLNPELVTNGPYKYVRHPIYTGVLLSTLGSAFLSGVVWIIIFIVAALYFFYNAKKEEKTMKKEFGKKYLIYVNHTKMFIPFIY